MDQDPSRQRRGVSFASGEPAAPRGPARTLAAPLLTILLLAAAFVPSGARAADGVPICAAPRDQNGTVTAADGAGGAYVAWIDNRQGYNTDVVLTHLDRNIVRTSGWEADGTHVTFITCQKTDLAMLANTTGAWLAWADNRCSTGAGYDIYAARMTPQGKPAAGQPANGIPLTLIAGDQVHTAITDDGAGGVFVAWTDQSISPARVFLHHVLANATIDARWPAGGLLLSSTAPDSARPSLVSDDAQGVLVAWEDTRGADQDLMLARITDAGVPATGWPTGGLFLVRAAATQYAPQLLSDGTGGATAVWIDRRDGVARLYAKHTDALGAGTSGWPVSGRAVAAANGDQTCPSLVADGTGGAFIAWQDGRDANGPAVYAQRLDAFGAAVPGWSASGTRVTNASGPQVTPKLSGNAQGGVFMAWLDGRRHLGAAADIYVQRLAGDGTIVAGWPAAGNPVCDAAGDRSDLAMSADTGAGVFVAWSDARALATQGSDIACASVLPAGPTSVLASGLSAAHHDGQTFLTWRAPPGAGWNYRIYRSTQPMLGTADLANATLLGTAGDSSACDRRLTSLLKQTYGFVIDSLAAPLDPALGMFVNTPAANGAAYYAVTTQNGVFSENRAIMPGGNSLGAAITELLAAPRPVFQRELYVRNQVRAKGWTLWGSAHDSPFVPALTNAEGMPFDFATVPPFDATALTSLMMPLHYRGGSFLDAVFGTGVQGEAVLALDDGLPNGMQSFWYGWANTIDVRAPATLPPTTGTVVDYTIRRTRYLIDLAQQTMALDPGRTYTYGYSMGGAGATNIAFHLGDRIAGAISAVGNSDLSFMADPDTAFFFSLHGYLRQDIDRLWGTVATNLPAAAGGRVYEQLNCGFLATDPAHGVVPPVFVFNGKRDTTMGWAENIGFYQAMERGHRGGAFYWEDVPHNTTYAPAWQPLRTPRDLYRYRTDLSFPALSNCSIDDDPGDGVASHGAPLGCINGYARWDSLVTDTSPRWQVGLQLRTLVLTDRTLTPPDSARIDVTPRRVQRFAFTPGRELLWKVLRLPDSLTVQQGGLVVPANGELTIPGVRVYAKGSVLRIEPDLHLGLGDNAAAALRPGITFARSPVRGRAAFRIVWPARGAARADLYDVSGRAVRALFRGEAGETPSDLALETGTLAPGLYLVGAEVAGRRIAGRVVVLR